jgi:hypothetical protein
VLILRRRTRQFRQTDDAAQAQLRVSHVQRQSLLVEFRGPGSEQALLITGRGKIVLEVVKKN